MKRGLASLAILTTLIFPLRIVFAGTPPLPVSPQNNSTVTSSKLEWQAPSYTLYTQGNPYRVQVDDSPDFMPVSSIYRTAYTDNTFYSPQLIPGTWYWRVMAKDASGTWSSWSSVWQFTLTHSTTPSPSTSTSPTPTVTVLPSSTPASIPSLIISNIPSSASIDQEFSLTITVNNFTSNIKYFLKGAFKKAGGSNYFGQTLVSGIWVKNYESYNKHFPLTTDSSGNWSGVLSAKGDLEDSGFVGAGDYIFKVGYYKEGAPSVAWSNESSIHLVDAATPTPILTTLQTTPKETKTKPSKQNIKINLPRNILGTRSATLAASMHSNLSPSESPTYTAGFSVSYLFIVGGGLIITLSAVLAYTILKRHYGNI